MKRLDTLIKELNALKEFQVNARHAIQKECEDIMRKQLTRNKKFVSVLKQLEGSTELTSVKYDEYFHRYIRVDFSQFIDADDEFQRELFQQCLDSMGTHAYADFKNDCLSTSEGPCITVNWSPSRNSYFVYDQASGKEIIAKDECLDDNGDIDEQKTKVAIEAWMSLAGYFPSIISVNAYDGSPNGYVNTQKGAQS
jgi:hypothetical protein